MVSRPSRRLAAPAAGLTLRLQQARQGVKRAVSGALLFVSHAMCVHARLLIESDNNRMCRRAARPTASARLHPTRAPAMGCIASTLGGEAGSTARSALQRSRVRGGVSAMLHPCPTAYMYRTCTA